METGFHTSRVIKREDMTDLKRVFRYYKSRYIISLLILLTDFRTVYVQCSAVME